MWIEELKELGYVSFHYELNASSFGLPQNRPRLLMISVYVGQASDLERRTRQHLTDKDWWTQVILLTTKDDSFNASDIDYLEARLIDLAKKAGKSDSDNKKRGNPQKVDEFRQAELEQYLEEALFLSELIGIRVFKKETRKTKKTYLPTVSLTTTTEVKESKKLKSVCNASEMKIGAFVYDAMQKLADSGYTFTTQQIDEMTTSEWSKLHFHTKNPFMKRFVPGETDNKGKDGYVRFKSKPFAFGDQQVLISKEWYESQREYFIEWYSSLL